MARTGGENYIHALLDNPSQPIRPSTHNNPSVNQETDNYVDIRN